jgi:hypothetical protein
LTNNYSLSVEACANLKIFPKRVNCVIFKSTFGAAGIEFPHVRRIHFMGSNLGDRFSTRANEMLFQSLFHVKIYNCNDIVSLQGLKTVPVVELISLQNLTDISNLGGNKVVEINDCQVISAFSSLKNVPKVFICDCTSFTNGCDVEDVRYLKITYCDNFANPDALENVFDLTVANNAVEDLFHVVLYKYVTFLT